MDVRCTRPINSGIHHSTIHILHRYKYINWFSANEEFLARPLSCAGVHFKRHTTAAKRIDGISIRIECEKNKLINVCVWEPQVVNEHRCAACCDILYTTYRSLFKANSRYSQCDYLFSFAIPDTVEHRNKSPHMHGVKCALCIDVVSNKIYVICK